MSRSARRLRYHPGFNPGAWLTRHLQTALGSLGHLLRTPLGSSMTVTVIGIALALPAGTGVLLANLQQVLAQWEGPASISLFLKDAVSDEQAQQLSRRLSLEFPVEAELIDREAAMEEFRSYSGFGDALAILEENPLPAVILLRLDKDSGAPRQVQNLAERMRQLPEVDLAQLDLQWVQRLQGIAEAARRGAYLVTGLLGLAVLLIIGNTIRLEIQNRHEEIAITKLVGATDAFVRRPFLYHGLWLGLSGGLVAWLLVSSAVSILAPPITHLADLYHSGFRLRGLDLGQITGLLGGGTLIGWIGAWIAVGRHIHAIEPE